MYNSNHTKFTAQRKRYQAVFSHITRLLSLEYQRNDSDNHNNHSHAHRDHLRAVGSGWGRAIRQGSGVARAKAAGSRARIHSLGSSHQVRFGLPRFRHTPAELVASDVQRHGSGESGPGGGKRAAHVVICKCGLCKHRQARSIPVGKTVTEVCVCEIDRYQVGEVAETIRNSATHSSPAEIQASKAGDARPRCRDGTGKASLTADRDTGDLKLTTVDGVAHLR